MISSCWNVIFPNDSNLNRNLGYSSVYRNSRVVVNPKMVRFNNSYTNYLDYTWTSGQAKYVGIDTPSWTGYSINGYMFPNGGVFCKTPTTPIPSNLGSNVTVINWHEADNTYWVVTGSSGSTGT